MEGYFRTYVSTESEREGGQWTEVDSNSEKIEMWEMKDEALTDFEKWELMKASEGMCR